MSIRITVTEAHELVTTIMKSGLVPYVKGSPGMGKSYMIQAVADQYNLKLIDLRLAQCDPTDLMGFPHINTEGTKAGYVPMATFPIEGDPLPINPDTKEAYAGWLLFCDEMNAADRSTQKAAYKLILDKMVGVFHLHDKVAIVCAGNLDTDQALVEEISTALQSRLIHITVQTDTESWLDWAIDNNIDSRICSFIRFKPALLNNFDPDKAGSEDTYACERTWAFADKLLANVVDIRAAQVLPLFAGTLGEGVAREFLAFLRVYKDLPTIAEIIAAPSTIPVPTEPSVQFALTGSIAQNAEDNNIEKLMEYLDRLPVEFQVICLREMGRRNPNFIKIPAVVRWITDKNVEIFR